MREITTPSLPPFITSCLDIATRRASSAVDSRASAKSELLDTILDAFRHLLPRHPTLFRPFVGRIQILLLPLLAPTPSCILSTPDNRSLSSILVSVPQDQKDRAQRLFVLLHCCAPKSTSGEEWRKAIRTTIADTHHGLNKVFRAVIEDWESTTGASGPGAASQVLGNVIEDGGEDLLGLPSWQGISAGIERACGLLKLLQAFINGSTSSTVSLPIGPIMDLLTRIFSLVVPSKQGSDDWNGSARLNPQISRDERDGLWAGLPQIHVAAMGGLTTIAARLDESFVPLAQGAQDQVSWVFAAEKSNSEIRTATYVLVARLLDTTGPSLTRSSVSSLAKIIRSCCDDLLPPPTATVTAAAASSSKQGSDHSKKTSSIDADAFLTSPMNARAKPLAYSAGLHGAASALLPLFLSQLPSQHLSYPLRSQIDRTAVLTQHKQAMLASVLNPAPNRKGSKAISSIMPLLARSFGEDLEVEGLLRPRMPVLQIGKHANGDIELEDEDEDDDQGRLDDIAMDRDGLAPTNGAGGDDGLTRPPVNHDDSPGWPAPKATAQGSAPAALPEDVNRTILPRTATIQSPLPNTLATSTKRTHETTEDDITTIIPAHAPSPKRIRFGTNTATTTTDQMAEPAMAVTVTQNILTQNLTPPDTAAVSISAQISSATAHVQEVGGDDSDDGEIPPLVMDSDTDDEDDDDDDDDDQAEPEGEGDAL